MSKHLLAIFVLAAGLGGCMTVGPDYEKPKVDVPAVWPGASTEAPVSVRWWTLYSDPHLDLLVDEALAHNTDLRVAAARVDEALALLAITRADQLPNVKANGAAGRNRFSENSALAFPGISPEYRDYTVSLNASWEIDFWGKYRRATEAARADLLATQSARDAVQLSLAATVTRAYFNLRALDAQVEITQQRLETRAKALGLEKMRYDAGESSELQYRQIEGETLQAKALLPVLEQQAAQQESALAVLVGRSPRDLMERGVDRGLAIEALALPPAVPAGLPSDLLTRRPDLYQAEQTLIAANARIGVARAAYYPSISLTGIFGFESDSLSNLLSAPSRLWTFSASAAQTVFDAGRTKGQVDAATARREQMLAQYQGTVQNAFREVKDALVASRKSAERLSAEQARVEALRTALRLASMRYKAGESSLLDALVAERSLLDADLDRVAAQRDQLSATTDLFQALGGGWNAPAEKDAVAAKQ
jgi:multidrug efflux system outer membrane protein